MKSKLFIATENKGKIRELVEILKPYGWQLITPQELSIHLHVEEDGLSYAENAAKKALAYAKAANLPAIADDSGLEVDALNGAPGLYSARYLAKPNATDADRRAFLLQNLKDIPRPWKAHFHATIAIAQPHTDEVYFAEGNCQGEIIPKERGQGGFGYDALFYIAQYKQTMAELTEKQKNSVSHRALAVQNAIPILENLLKN